MSGRFIAIDWGTTNRRCYLVQDGELLRGEGDGRGALAVGPGGWEAEVAGVRARFGDLPLLCAGMVGSSRGWREACYVPCPATLGDLAAAMLRIDARTMIVPGVMLRRDDRRDVMRGEEVQLLGAVAAGLAPRDALLCQPGTHAKWAWLRGGAIARFATAMTGEVFALLQTHSLLAPQMAGAVAPGEAFLAGVADSARGDLLADLFGVRADALLGGPRAEAAYASGLLIGSDVRARRAAEVWLVADGAVGVLYAAAIEALGGAVHPVASEAAFVAGAAALYAMAR